MNVRADILKGRGRGSGLRACRAFTLIEIMVALALFGLVVAAIYSSWIAVVRGSQVGRKAAAAAQRSRVAVRTLEQALTCACSFQADVQYYSFDAENGSDASLSFTARLPKSFPRGGRFGDMDVRRVTFSMESGSSGHKLVLRQAPLLMDMDDDEKEHPVVLASNVKKFELAFWDPRTSDWLDEWTATNQLPDKIKFTLEFGDGKGSHSKTLSQVTSVIALPAMAVSPNWQMPGRAGALQRGGPGIIRPGDNPVQPRPR